MNRVIARAIKQAIQKQRDRGTLFENKVRAWWEIDKNGKMKKCDNQTNNENEMEEDVKNLTEVHVRCMGTKIPSHMQRRIRNMGKRRGKQQQLYKYNHHVVLRGHHRLEPSKRNYKPSTNPPEHGKCKRSTLVVGLWGNR